MAHLRRYSLAATLLRAAGAIGMIAIAILAPNALTAVKSLLPKEDWRAIRQAKQKRIRETLRRLAERRLISFVIRDGKEYVQITADGKTTLRQFDFETISLPREERWDMKWRLVLFDIPETHRRGRQVLQAKLQAIGFYPLQRSVLAYPYHCQDEVDFLMKFLELDRFAIYCETTSLGSHEGKARRFFSLLNST